MDSRPQTSSLPLPFWFIHRYHLILLGDEAQRCEHLPEVVMAAVPEWSSNL